MGKMSELSLAASELPTCVLVSALLERVTETNGLCLCAPEQVTALRDALTYEPFGERLLLSLVMLHVSHDGTSVPDSMFYDLLDSQTDEECEYYCQCDSALMHIV